MIQEREYTTWAAGVPATELRIQGLQLPTKPPSEGSELLRQFCQTGLWPDKERDLFAKELLYYRVLDLFAQTNNIGIEDTTREKSVVPSMTKLVRYDSLTLDRLTCSVRVTQALTIGQSSSIPSQRSWSSLPATAYPLPRRM